jgi:peptide/nickel transport system permease protein
VILWDWTVYARVGAVQTRQIRRLEYVAAAEVIGYSRLHILRRHILPQVARASVAYAIADAVTVLMATASLPFVGAGVQPPTAEWGMMMYEGRTVLVNAPWVVLVPGAMLAISAIALSLLADGLLKREELDR